MLFEVKINNRRMLDENYTDLTDACTAFHTAINVLATAQASCSLVELTQRPSAPNSDGTIEAPRTIASCTIGVAGSFELNYTYVDYADGAYRLHAERVV